MEESCGMSGDEQMSESLGQEGGDQLSAGSIGGDTEDNNEELQDQCQSVANEGGHAADSDVVVDTLPPIIQVCCNHICNLRSAWWKNDSWFDDTGKLKQSQKA